MRSMLILLTFLLSTFPALAFDPHSLSQDNARHPRRAHTITMTLPSPSRFIGGALKCAENVNAALREMGRQGTGSRMAKSFLSWGRSTAPVPGAVAVYHRGGPRSKSGHVAIVSRVVGSTVYVWNPSRRHGRWVEVAYHRRAIDYRI